MTEAPANVSAAPPSRVNRSTNRGFLAIRAGAPRLTPRATGRGTGRPGISISEGVRYSRWCKGRPSRQRLGLHRLARAESQRRRDVDHGVPARGLNDVRPYRSLGFKGGNSMTSNGGTDHLNSTTLTR